jgi:hypothetical protein
MNLPNGLVALPADLDLSFLFAADTSLNPAQQRERAFVIVNERLAEFAPDPESAALEKIANFLGDEYAAPSLNPVDAECRAVKARRHAREAANAAIAAGYNP